jgi:hypothetical protein
LAELFTPLLFADLFSAARTSLSGRSNDEFDVGVACGRQARLRWRPVDSFSAPPVQDAIGRQADINSASSDRLGLLGIPVHSASLIRLAGATFMILGVVLIRT